MLINYSLNFAPDLSGAEVMKKGASAAVRRHNLLRWLQENPVPAKEKSYFSQLTTGVASFGEKAARRLESDYSMGDGYLDLPVDADLVALPAVTPGKRSSDTSIDVPQYRDVIGSMGRGIILKDQPGQITSLRVTNEWLSKNVPANTGRENLCVVTGFGDSMKGMYNPGDPLLVDAGIKGCEYDGVYFFRVGDEGFIKRLQRIPGVGIRVISENKKYETWTITADMDFEVFAKVLKVWQSTDF
jgi:phage repressor protein C with HTH and peptisase S24 domain